MNTTCCPLTLINPSDIPNTTYDNVFIDDTTHIEENNVSLEMEDDNLMAPRSYYSWILFDEQEQPHKNYETKIGDGTMEYISNQSTKELLTNIWKAITLTDNWKFVDEDVDTLLFSEETTKTKEITAKIEELGYDKPNDISFAYALKCMHYLVQHGEEEFKHIFASSTKTYYETQIYKI